MRSRAGTAVFQLSPCPFTSVVGQQRQSLPPFFEMVGASHLNATDQRQQTLSEVWSEQLLFPCPVTVGHSIPTRPQSTHNTVESLSCPSKTLRLLNGFGGHAEIRTRVQCCSLLLHTCVLYGYVLGLPTGFASAPPAILCLSPVDMMDRSPVFNLLARLHAMAPSA